MKIIQAQINTITRRVEAGELSYQEAQIAIAELTTELPQEDTLSDTTRSFMIEEITKMPISEAEKLSLRDDLSRR